jgi:hypothetical protein
VLHVIVLIVGVGRVGCESLGLCCLPSRIGSAVAECEGVGAVGRLGQSDVFEWG